MTRVSAPLRTLVLFAHPGYHRSRVNRALVEAVRGMDGLTFHDLYEAYPDFDVDVGREQGLLAAHDLVVFQHPFYWYGVPPLLKQWMDLVLEHGWAYGREGRALEGRLLLSAVTTGGRESAYTVEGPNRHTVRQFLAPIEQTARLCRMTWLPPFVVHGTHAMTPEEARRAGADYRLALEALRDRRLEPAGVADLPSLNPALAPWRAD
jgi:glutathione-regulated potassium-efflux system ancillary protein KefG